VSCEPEAEAYEIWSRKMSSGKRFQGGRDEFLGELAAHGFDTVCAEVSKRMLCDECCGSNVDFVEQDKKVFTLWWVFTPTQFREDII
jgi:hypothetical protein